MKKIIRALFSLACSLTVSFSQSGFDIAEKLDKKERPHSVSSRISMILTNSKNKSRKNVMISKSINRGKYQLLWVLEPKSDRGISFLRKEYVDRDNEIRMWLPAFNKIRRINSNRMSDSFMGSDLSYEDLNSRVLSDNEYERLSDEKFNGVNCYVMNVIPKIKINGSYSMHKVWVSKKDLRIMKEYSFDKNNEIIKTKKFIYETIKGYDIVSEISVLDFKRQHSTKVIIENIILNEGIEPKLFQEKNLKRIPKN